MWHFWGHLWPAQWKQAATPPRYRRQARQVATWTSFVPHRAGELLGQSEPTPLSNPLPHCLVEHVHEGIHGRPREEATFRHRLSHFTEHDLSQVGLELARGLDRIAAIASGGLR
jgi:hypothetical protein